MDYQKNSKSEIRNPKQIPITKPQNSKQLDCLNHLTLGFSNCLEFRISIFVFTFI